jgi:YVTN family beta-propeller protein
MPDTVSVIGVELDEVIATVPVGFGPLGLIVTSKEEDNKVYVPNSNSSTVSVIDVTNDEVSATIPVGSGPADVVITSDDKRVLVSNFNNPDSPGNSIHDKC